MFRFTYGPIEGTPLMLSSPRLDPLSKLIEKWRGILSAEHEIRVYVHFGHETERACLAADTFRHTANSERWMRVTWRHGKDRASIWRTARELLAKVAKVALTPIIRWLVTTEKEARTGENQDIETIADIMAACEHPTFFELSTGDFTFFADITPFFEVEMQAGIYFRASLLDNLQIQIGELLARDIYESHIEEIHFAHWDYICGRIAPLFHETQ